MQGDFKQKTGRIIGTAAATVLVVSLVAIIYMAMQPNVLAHGDSSLDLLPPPGSQTPSQ